MSKEIKVGQAGKRYGLIIPKKSTAVSACVRKAAIFGEESSEDEGETQTVGPVAAALLQKKKYESKVNTQTQLEIDKALADDPTCYQYDDVYDKMVESRKTNDVRSKQKLDKKPRYIGGLLKAAQQRKREYERYVEKGIQKEREKEGDEFADKESFVTSAYKKKMEEMQAEEEKERRDAEREAVLDVTRQSDLSGFYRYIYKETTGSDETDRSVSKEDEVKSGDNSAEDRVPDIGLKGEKRFDRPRDEASSEDVSSSPEVHRRRESDGVRISSTRSPSSPSRTKLSRSSVRNSRGHSDQSKSRRSPIQGGTNRERSRDRSRSRERLDESVSQLKTRKSGPGKSSRGDSSLRTGIEQPGLDTNQNEAPISSPGSVPGRSDSDKTTKQLYLRKTSDSAVDAARERYLARKATRRNVAPVVSRGDD